MSVSYALVCSSSTSPDIVMSELKVDLGLRADGHGSLVREGLFVDVLVHDGTYTSVDSQLLGSEPDFKVLFDPDDTIEDDEQEMQYWQNLSDMMRACVRFLDRHRLNGFLTVDNNRILLQRWNGRVTLNEDYANWSVIQPENFGVPFDMKSIVWPVAAVPDPDRPAT